MKKWSMKRQVWYWDKIQQLEEEITQGILELKDLFK